jgi:hypothetical protein
MAAGSASAQAAIVGAAGGGRVAGRRGTSGRGRPGIGQRVARGPAPRAAGRQRRLRQASRVPETNSIGSAIPCRCAPRIDAGAPAGCSGKPRNASPASPGIGAAAWASDVIRPPIDLPPAISRRPGARVAACRQAARASGRTTAGRSARRLPAVMAGISQRKVVTPRAASAAAIAIMNGWCMPAPAPWPSA